MTALPVALNPAPAAPQPAAAPSACDRVFPVFKAYEGALLRFIQRRVGCPQDSHDLKQEVLLKVHKNCEQLQHVNNLQAWLFQIGRNVVNDYFRERKRHEHAMQALVLEGNPEETSWNKEVLECLIDLIDKLPPEYAEPLRLSDVEREAQANIAQRLGLSVSGAKSRIQRGRQQLKALFMECCQPQLIDCHCGEASGAC